jgi:hypothetical protein
MEFYSDFEFKSLKNYMTIWNVARINKILS